MKRFLMIKICEHSREGYRFTVFSEYELALFKDDDEYLLVQELTIDVMALQGWLSQRSDMVADQLRQAAMKQYAESIARIAEFESKFLLLPASGEAKH